MKPALRTPLAIGAVLIGAVVAYSAFRSSAEESRAQVERALLKREFIERTSVARGLATDRLKEWKDEIRAILRWYFDEITAIQNRHPGEKRASELTGAPENKLAKESEKATRAEFAKYAVDRFDMLRDGKYEPIYAAVDQGLHIDFLSFGPSQGPDGQKALRIDFAIWGVPRRIEREVATATSSATTRVVVPVAFKELAFKFFVEEDKLFAGMAGAAEPYMKIADPERFVEDYPPGVMFGSWYVDLMPAETLKVEMTLTLEVRGSAGADLAVSYKWIMDAKDEWKLRPGEVYKAEIQQ
jgi:hypothetical protein